MRKTVFWSWQSDLSAAITKDFIKAALAQALEKVAEELQLETADRLELDHDTKGEPGLVEIVSTIFKKIDDCEIFVADITPIAEAGTSMKKKIPNPNVMLELGYAMREVGPQRVITVANLAFGGNPEEMPFDLRHRRGAITYNLESATDPAIERIRKNLVKQLVVALTTNLAAPREDQLIRNPMPVLSIETAEETPNVLVVKQDVQLNDGLSLAAVMERTPLKTIEQQKAPPSPLDSYRFLSIGMFPHERIKPFREWTEEELDGYNKRVQSYYVSYEKYLEQLKEHTLLMQRAVIVRLVVVNRGTRPATGVWARITFPDGFLIYENDEVPKAPDQPTAPPLAPYGVDRSLLVGTSRSLMPYFQKPPRIDDDHKSIMFRSDKLAQGFQRDFDSFTIVMSTPENIRSFTANYQVRADELPHAAAGVLQFEVQQTD